MGLHPRIWMAVPDDGDRLPPPDRGGCLGGLVALGVITALVLAVLLAVWQWSL